MNNKDLYVDLHVHSTASDGTMTPSQVVELAVSKNLTAIALTDHDTIDGVEEAIQTAALFNNSIEIISGIELSVAYKEKDIHILGLFVDHKNNEFILELEKARKKRDHRNIKMVENLANAGIDITIDKLKAMAADSVLTRAHFGKYLMAKGYVKSIKDAFDIYLGDDSPYYVQREYLSPKEGIELIHKAGGLAILAHPLIYKYSLKEVEILVDYLYDCNIDGIEIIHSSNTGLDEGHLRRFANKHNLLYSGGSDFHGDNKPNLSIGIGYGNLKIKKEILDDMKVKLLL